MRPNSASSRWRRQAKLGGEASMSLRKPLFLAVVLLTALPVSAQENNPAGLDLFEKKIRPLLAENCYKCHSAKSEKLKAGLYLDSRDAIVAGGDSGPSVVPGNPDKSLIIKAVRWTDKDLQMPPKTKLSDSAIADLTQWVKMGAPWPKEAAPAAAGAPKGA